MTTSQTTSRDHLIREDVLEELAWSPDVDDTRIGVSVLAGAVTLSGEVESHAERVAAVKAARRVRNVIAVADDLETRADVARQHTDTDLAVALANRLRWSAQVPAETIQVEVRDGEVTLTGTLDHEFQRRVAGRIVGDVLGVSAVHNAIKLAERASADDTRHRIKQALVRDALVDADAVEVQTVGTEVTLRGAVRSWAERSAARRAAWSSPHVTAVHDKLVVRS